MAGDPSGDREAESAAGRGLVETDEALEDSLALALRDARTVVGHARFDVPVVPRYVDANAAAGRDRCDRIVEQVAEDTRKRVAVDESAEAGRVASECRLETVTLGVFGGTRSSISAEVLAGSCIR